MAKRLTPETIRSIRDLRTKGYSLPEIKQVIPVGNGSIYRYIKDVPIDPRVVSYWRGKRGGSRKRKEFAEQSAYEDAMAFCPSTTEKEKILIMAVLYWAEGSKKDFSLINSDPDLIRVFILALTECLHISLSQLRVGIRIYEDMNADVCLNYWSSITGIPKINFSPVVVLHGKKAGKLPYGMCRVRLIKGGNTLKYVVALKKAVIGSFIYAPVAQRIE